VSLSSLGECQLPAARQTGRSASSRRSSRRRLNSVRIRRVRLLLRRRRPRSVFISSKQYDLIRPPGTVVTGGLVFYCCCPFLSFFFSTQDRRAPSADCRETSPRDRKWVMFYSGCTVGHIPEIFGAKTCKIRRNFV